MTVTREQVESVLASILASVPAVSIRLVGTASSILRGIPVAANDVDVLFRDRAGLDAWFDRLSSVLEVDTAPEWLAGSQQYFARLHAADVAVELSTVEIQSESDTIECYGPGPWRYFDILDCGPFTVPAVATELRLITEVSRVRADRYGPIVDHLRAAGCDVALIARGFAGAGVEPETAARIVADLSPGGPR